MINTVPEGNSKFRFPRIDEVKRNIEIEGKQNLPFPSH